MNFSTAAYRVGWTYDESVKRYRRISGGVVADDRTTREQLTAKNVIVLIAKVDPAPPPAPDVAVVVEVAHAARG